MIRFFRDDEYALKLEFNLVGIKELVNKFQVALNDGEAILNIDKESILEIQEPIKYFKVTNKGKPSEIYYKSEILIIELDKDIIEFCLERFNECIEGNDFFPAEICDVDYKDEELTLYGMFIS